MSWTNRVMWQEGMFLRSRHFQEQNRWLEASIRGKVAALDPHRWGFTRIAPDNGLLGTGRFSVAAAAGVFGDGTRFSFPDETVLPSPIAIPENTQGVLVHLALAVRQNDSADGKASKRLCYLLDTDDLSLYLYMPIARIAEISAEGRVTLDEHWLPPILACDAAPALAGLITEFTDLINQCSEAMATKVNAPGARGVAEVADFMLLLAVDRWQTLLGEWADAATLHPETLYTVYTEMAAEFASFTATRRSASYPGYFHDDLQRSFAPVVADLRHMLASLM